MTTKYCYGCKQTKDVSCFYKNRSKHDGLRQLCKDCKHIEGKIHREKRKTNINIFISHLYGFTKGKMQYYARIKGNPELCNFYICGRDDFLKFAHSSETLKILFNNWAASNNETLLRPTMDRIDNTRGYFVDNIKFMALKDNIGKAEHDRKNGSPPWLQ